MMRERLSASCPRNSSPARAACESVRLLLRPLRLLRLFLLRSVLGLRAVYRVLGQVARAREPHVEQICDDERVEYEYACAHESRLLYQFIQLDRQVDAARDYREPLGPRAHLPEAVRLHEAHRRVDEGERGERPQSRVTRVRGGLYEDAWVVARRVEVRMPHEPLGQVFKVAVYEREQPETRDQHERALNGLEERDGAHAHRNLLDDSLRDFRRMRSGFSH